MQVLLGADAVVAQSNEAGGHGASGASLMTLLPELVDRVNAAAAQAGLQRSVPVLAAGEEHVCCLCGEVVHKYAAASSCRSRQDVHTASASAPLHSQL